MDSIITAAALALASGDPLGALNRVALRNDPAALALRGIAMAQLGDLVRARVLLRAAARGFGPREALSRARCRLAEAEVALATRDLNGAPGALEATRRLLQAQGDTLNAAHAGYLIARRLLLIGRPGAAEQALRGLDPAVLPAASRALHELVHAGIAIRRLRTQAARDALARARQAAVQAGIGALIAEVDAASRSLDAPAARLIGPQGERLLSLTEVEALQASPALVIDACRHHVREAGTTISLATRPILFTLARQLAEAWPDDLARDALVAGAFRLKLADESHRARLRVEIGRLRTMLAPFAQVRATARGYQLLPHRAEEVLVLARPMEERHAAVLALLADGEAWSSSALALALGYSQRKVQRALDSLAAANKVQCAGRGRARRWMTPPVPGFTTALLLPSPLPGP